MASQARATSWLTENGPRELELLFQAVLFHPFRARAARGQ